MNNENEPITVLLNRGREGDREALDRLFPVLYDELRVIARKHLRGERPNHTLQATELVHEAYPQLIEKMNWENRTHFFAFAAKVMRSLLNDHAKKKHAFKRGGDQFYFVTLKTIISN